VQAGDGVAARRDYVAGAMRPLPLLSLVLAASACSTSSSSSPPPSRVSDASDTNDGGSPWTKVLDVHVGPVRAVWGSSANDVYAVGGPDGTIHHSTDGGSTWATQSLSAPGEYLNLVAIWGSSASDVYVVGHDIDYRPRALHSADSGATWQTLPPPHHGNGLDAIAGSGPNDVYVVDSGALVHTSDGGASWTSIDVPALVNAIWIASSGDVFVAGGTTATSDAGPPDGGPHDGLVLRSRDHGGTWDVVASTTTGVLFSIAGSADGARLAAVGAGGTVLRSDDSGATWLQASGAAEEDGKLAAQLLGVWFPSGASDPLIGCPWGLCTDVDVEPGRDLFFSAELLPGAPERSPIDAIWGTSDGVTYAAGMGLWRSR
jgi:photosystem II stability/assembly factor-like uncharacterized protein